MRPVSGELKEQHSEIKKFCGHLKKFNLGVKLDEESDSEEKKWKQFLAQFEFFHF